MNDLRNFFKGNAEGHLITKWDHYFDIYDRHFSRYRNKELLILEIGIYHGGSLDMWRDYFGPQCKVVGMDINPDCTRLAKEGIEIIIGDQEDRAFLAELAKKLPPIDILIDDGGHTMPQQINTYEMLYNLVKPDGVYLCEDLHTSYWPSYSSAYKAPHSFIEYSKKLIDQLHAEHAQGATDMSFAATTQSLHFYDSVLVLEKQPKAAPEPIVVKKFLPEAG